MFTPHAHRATRAAIALAAMASAPLAQQDQTSPAVRIAGTGDSVQVRNDDRLLLEYRAGGDPWKTYALHLCSPGGIDVLRVSPPDHVHHRGLMFALGAGDFDFWGEHYVERPGRQRGAPIGELGARASATGAEATFAQRVEWVAGDPERTIVRETRRIAVATGTDPGATLVSWHSELEAPATVALWGRHYFGLGARFAAAMDGNGHFVTPSGEPGEVVRGDERLVRGDWCAYVASVDGHAVTVAMFGHPDNPRAPTTWFTMREPFAYLAATLALEHEPMELRAGATLRLCYGIAVWDGEVAPARIAATRRRWLAALPSPQQEERR